MGRGIYLFCDHADNLELAMYAKSIGLIYVAPLCRDGEIDVEQDEAEGPYCYLSTIPLTETHPYGEPPGIGSATDPMLSFIRPYYKSPNLVMGRLYWSDDDPQLGKLTKPYFNKLATWIKKRWRRNSDGQYVGDGAQKLIDEGCEIAYFPPGVPIRTILVGDQPK